MATQPFQPIFYHPDTGLIKITHYKDAMNIYYWAEQSNHTKLAEIWAQITFDLAKEYNSKL